MGLFRQRDVIFCIFVDQERDVLPWERASMWSQV